MEEGAEPDSTRFGDAKENVIRIPEPTPLPRTELIIIWIIHASQAFQTTMLFPMLVFMVEHYRVGSRSTHSAGQYAGLLASLFPLAQCCTSLLWGTISDCTGRKPWLAFGNIVSAVSALLLGVCQSYTGACAVRFLGGLLNGTMTITKSVLGEICDGYARRTRPKDLAFSIWHGASVRWLVQFSRASLHNHVNMAALFSTGAVFAALWLRETVAPREDLRELEIISCHECIVTSAATDHTREQEAEQLLKATKGQEAEQLPKAPCQTTWPLLKDRNVLLTSFCYSLTGLIFITTDELFPIFGAAAESVGGLGLSSSSLGFILGEGGVVLFVYTLLLYPKVAQRIGPLYCFRLGLLSSVPLWLIFPMASLLDKAPKLRWLLLAAAMAARSVIACTTFTGVLVLVSNSASSGNMGAVTGLSHSLCSFFRAVGPALGGLIWSYAARQTFPLHQFLAWLLISCISLIAFCMSTLLPQSLTLPKS